MEVGPKAEEGKASVPAEGPLDLAAFERCEWGDHQGEPGSETLYLF